MDIAIVIPSRYGSKRLPGKPMLPIRIAPVSAAGMVL